MEIPIATEMTPSSVWYESLNLTAVSTQKLSLMLVLLCFYMSYNYYSMLWLASLRFLSKRSLLMETK